MPEMKLDGRDGLTVIQDAELATLCAVLNLLSLSYHGQILLCKWGVVCSANTTAFLLDSDGIWVVKAVGHVASKLAPQTLDALPFSVETPLFISM
jgi:hypothetical protein